MKRVLILTASYGDGHNAAAQNLSAAVERLDPSARVAVIDPLQGSYGALNTAARNAYNGIVRYAPFVWGGIYSLLDSHSEPEKRFIKLSRLRRTIGNLLQDTHPDCVVSTYPLYATIIQDLYQDHAERPFPLVTVVTDSVTVSASWLQASSDIYCVANEDTAKILRERGVPAARIKPLGFPVSPLFCQKPAQPVIEPGKEGACRILYMVDTGKKKLGKAIKKLLAVPEFYLTIAVGRNPHLKAKLLHNLARYGERVQVLGWTNQIPELMMRHHLLIGKAGGALVQEAIAACCPMIANQVIPGQEEGNAALIEQNDFGVIAEKTGPMVDWARHAFKNDARLWRRWRENLSRITRPDAALRIAELILDQCECAAPSKNLPAIAGTEDQSTTAPVLAALPSGSKQLLCDFHIHSNYSDGKLSIPQIVDFYGSRKFDCICITDHLADPRRLIGRLSKLARLTLSPHQFGEYFEIIERERRRAWRKYSMLVLAGLEFNKDGLTKKSSAHLLGIDLQQPLPDDLDLPETIACIHAQQGLAVASHPHIMKSEWGKNTLYLWENQETFAPLIDAWEVANRNNMFNPVSSKRLPYIANSDFHKPKHIYSWKTLLHCQKSADAIKHCIRKNEHVAITLYRDGIPAIAAFSSDDRDRAEQFDRPGNRAARAVAKSLLLPAA